MPFDSISPQMIETSTTVGRLNSKTIATPSKESIENAIHKFGIRYQVKARPDGSLSFETHDLGLNTIIEIENNTELSIADAIKLQSFIDSGKLRCQSPFRDSTSVAAFLSLGSDNKPFIFDSGTDTKHWLNDSDWDNLKKINQKIHNIDITPLFDLSSASITQYLDSPPPKIRWLLKDCMQAGKVGMITAKGGTGKSQFVLQMGISVATGEPLAGVFEIGEYGPVLLLAAEDDIDQIHRRLHNCVNTLSSITQDNVTFNQRLDKNLFIKSMVAENNLMTHAVRGGEVTQTDYADRLIATVADLPDLKLIIVDPASRFRGGDENASQDATRFVEALEKVAKATGAAVIVVHHMNKNSASSSEQTQDASRGSSAFTDGVRWQMNLATFTTKEASEYGIPDDERGSYLSVTNTKNNYAPMHSKVMLKRGEGGFLNCIELTSSKVKRTADVLSKVLEIISKETKLGKLYSKTGFVDKFGGMENPLGTANNALRKIVDEAIKSGKLAVQAKKLSVPGHAVPRAQIAEKV